MALAASHEALAEMLHGTPGCCLDRVRVVVVDDATGDRRLHAVRAISAGEEVLSIGAAAVVTLERAALTITARELAAADVAGQHNSCDGDDGGRAGGCGDNDGGSNSTMHAIGQRYLASLPDGTLAHCLMALFLLESVEGGCAGVASPLFAAYLATLPRLAQVGAQFPICWSASEVDARLGGSTMDLAVLGAADEVRKTYGAIVAASPFFARSFTFPQWRWARLMVSSRSFGVVNRRLPRSCGQGGAVQQHDRLMVPVADMMNHAFKRQTNWEWVEDKQQQESGCCASAPPTAAGRFVVRAIRNIRPGEEVTCSYGAKSNARWLLGYGMVFDAFAVSAAGTAGDGAGQLCCTQLGCAVAAADVMVGECEDGGGGEREEGRRTLGRCIAAPRPQGYIVGSEEHASGCEACAVAGLDTVAFVLFVHDMFPLWERKQAQLNARYRDGCKVVVNTMHSDAGTREFLSLLRYLTADEAELDALPWREAGRRKGGPMEEGIRLGLDAILPLSLANECRVLEAVQQMMICQLQQQEEHAGLQRRQLGGERAVGEEHRMSRAQRWGNQPQPEKSAALVLQGEERVCRHYATFAAAGLALLHGARACGKSGGVVTLPTAAVVRQHVRTYALQLHEQGLLELAREPEPSDNALHLLASASTARESTASIVAATKEHMPMRKFRLRSNNKRQKLNVNVQPKS